MKTAISLPDELFEAAERVAKRLELSRSELYARAVAEYVRIHEGARTTRVIDEVLARVSFEPDLGLLRLSARSLGADEGAFEDWVDLPAPPPRMRRK